MKSLLLRLIKFCLFFVTFVLAFQFIVAYSTNYFPYLESVTFGCTDLKGGSYERTIEFQDWIEKNDTVPKGIILGPSTAYRNIDPLILNKRTNIDWFNFGNSTQTPNVSLTLLRQILEKNKTHNANIQYIIIDLFKPFINRRGDESCYDLIINSTLPFDQKFQVFCEAPTFKLFDQLTYRTIKNLIPHKIYRNEAQRDETYAHKGFVCSSKPKKTIRYSDFDSTAQTIEMTPSLQELITLCEENNIKLIVNLCPVLNKQTINHLNLRNVILNDDFNRKSELFYDSHHMHCDGAIVYSESLAHKIDSLISLNH